jgi:hypothetical protein
MLLAGFFGVLMMKKLITLLLLFFSSAISYAATVANPQIWLISSQQTISPQSSLTIPMNLLYPSKPYQIICSFMKTDVSSDPIIAPIFVSTPVLLVTYSLNGIPFTKSVGLTSSATNYLIAEGVEDLSGLYPWSSSELVIENKDHNNAVVVLGCVASPILGSENN